jgi:hypothetical protein
MDTALLVIAAVGGALAGIGGIVAAIYYGLRAYDWWREQGRVSLTLLSVGEGSCVDPSYDMLSVRLRFHNPKATPCTITRALFCQGAGAYVLKPIGEHRQSGYWYTGDAPIELPARQHFEVMLGHAMRKDAARSPTREHWVSIELADGSHIDSKLFEWPIALGPFE